MNNNNSFPEDDFSASEDYYSRHREENEDYYEDTWYPDDDDDDFYDDDFYEIETEDTWLYEWRGHYFYDRPTLKQKLLALMRDFIAWVEWKSKGYNDIPF